jgi:hypothetical protein
VTESLEDDANKMADEADDSGEDVGGEEEEEEESGGDSEEQSDDGEQKTEEGGSGDEEEEADEPRQIIGYFHSSDNKDSDNEGGANAANTEPDENQQTTNTQEDSVMTQQDIIRQFKAENVAPPPPPPPPPPSSGRINTDDEVRIKATMDPQSSIIVQLDNLKLLTSSTGGVKNFKPSINKQKKRNPPPPPPPRPDAENKQQPVVKKTGAKNSGSAPAPKKKVKAKVVDERLEAERRRKPQEPASPSPSSRKYSNATGGFPSTPGTPNVEVPNVELMDDDEVIAGKANESVNSLVKSSIAAALTIGPGLQQSGNDNLETPAPMMSMKDLELAIAALKNGSDNQIIQTLACVTGMAVKSNETITLAALAAQNRTTDMVSKKTALEFHKTLI